jgi:alpha-ketoglutarate-dependent taurine dioxygenase
METSLKKSLGTIRRATVDLAHFSPVKESTLGENKALPLVLQPAADHVDLAEWVRNNRGGLESKLYRHGGLLFRGFDLRSPEDFERVAGAICDSLFSEYGDLPREGVAGKVYTSTPYPNDKSILYHSESSHLHSWPRKINFFCVKVATEGGCTPVVDLRVVYRDLDPAIRQQFEEKGLMYVRNFSPGVDVPWQRFFHTDDRTAVEAECRKARMQCEWTHGGENLRLSQVCRAVAQHPVTGEKCFFNQVQLHHVYCLAPEVRESLLAIFSREDLPRHVYFGDGTVIDDSVMEHVGAVYERNAVRFQWQAGDMITLDNMLVAHARDPFVGERKILVALGDMITDEELARIHQQRAQA